MLKVGITCRYMYQSALNMDQHEPNTKEVLVKAFGSLPKGLPLGSLLLGITRRIRRLSYLFYRYSQVVNFPCECDGKSKKLE